MGGAVMAKVKSKLRMRAKKIAVRKNPVRASARGGAKAATRARRPHKFVISHLRQEDFKSDGLRTYAQYRDLGVKDATNGMAVAHVIRFVPPCDPKLVSKLHT